MTIAIIGAGNVGGPLAMARALEALAIFNIALQIQNGWPWQSGFKLIGPTPDKKPA
jgi:hypothetical protein